jgi:mannose/fructose/N-acetylgalactosamine-specific phosphotransferase system component IIC
VIVDLLPFVLLGAVCGLDVVSFPQVMISRPIVAATASAALGGHVGLGLALGATLELIALEMLPFGASRYPEWGSASVVGGALVAGVPAAGTVPAVTSAALVLAVLACLATSWVGGWTMVMLRRVNAVWARQARPLLDAGSRSAVMSLQLRGLCADLVRGGALTGIALVLLTPLVDHTIGHWGVDAAVSRAVVVGASATVAVAAAWKVFHTTRGVIWYFVAGVAAGAVLLSAVQ